MRVASSNSTSEGIMSEQTLDGRYSSEGGGGTLDMLDMLLGTVTVV